MYIQFLLLILLTGLFVWLKSHPQQSFKTGSVLWVPAMLGSVLIFNIVVDGQGYFGTGVFETQRRLDTNTKMDAYEALSTKPEALILGSSRSQAMPTAPFTTLCGLQGFNAAMGGAKVEENYAFFQYVMENAPPSIIVWGLDLWALNNYSVIGMELVGSPLYWHMSPDPILILRNYGTLISRQFDAELLNSNINLLYSSLQGTLNPTYLNIDAYGNIIPIESAEPPSSNLANASEFSLYAGYTGLLPARQTMLEDVLTSAEANAIPVAIFIPPMHATRIQLYEAQPIYRDRHAEVTDYLDMLTTQYPSFVWYDFTQVSAFDGIEDNFWDASHPRYENSQLILEAILKDLC